jgi:hypothetical protein
MQRVRLLAIGLALVLAAGSAFAQGTNGALEGQVHDEQGLALPGVSVTASNAATGFSRSTTTDATGVFRVPGLPVGNYDEDRDRFRAVEAHRGRPRHRLGSADGCRPDRALTVLAEAPVVDSRTRASVKS